MTLTEDHMMAWQKNRNNYSIIGQVESLKAFHCYSLMLSFVTTKWISILKIALFDTKLTWNGNQETISEREDLT